MLLCGAIIVALPWLMNRSHWDRGWDKPAVTPLWKAKVSRDGIGKLVFSADGTTISSPDAKGIRRWEAGTGKESPTLPQPAGYRTLLSSDGKIAAMVRKGALMRTTKVAFWQPVFKETSLNGSVYRVQVPGGTRVVINQQLFGGRGVEIWDVAAKKLMRVIPIRDDKPKQLITLYGADIVLSPDGSHLFMRFGQEYQMWDVRAGQLLWEKRNKKDFYTNPAFVFSADNKTVYQALSSDEIAQKIFPELRLIDKKAEAVVQTFAFKESNLNPWGNWIFWHPLAFSPTGRYLVAVRRSSQRSYRGGKSDGTIYCWETRTQKMLWTFQQKNFNPQEIAFAANEHTLAAGGENRVNLGSFAIKGNLVLINLTNGQGVSMLSEENPRDRFQQSKMQKEQQLAFRLNTYQRSPNTIYLPGDSGSATSLAFSPDSTKLAAGYIDGEIKMWKVPQ